MATIITFGLSPLFIGGYLFLDTSMGQRILAGTPDVITTLDASVSGSPQDAANRLAQDLSADTLVDATLDANLSVSDAAPSPVADVLDRGAKPASRHRVRFVGSHKAVRAYC